MQRDHVRSNLESLSIKVISKFFCPDLTKNIFFIIKENWRVEINRYWTVRSHQ